MVFTVEILFVVVIGSIGNGTMTLTGEATGAKDMKLYRSVVKTAIQWSFLVSAFALIFVSLFPRWRHTSVQPKSPILGSVAMRMNLHSLATPIHLVLRACNATRF